MKTALFVLIFLVAPAMLLATGKSKQITYTADQVYSMLDNQITVYFPASNTVHEYNKGVIRGMNVRSANDSAVRVEYSKLAVEDGKYFLIEYTGYCKIEKNKILEYQIRRKDIALNDIQFNRLNNYFAMLLNFNNALREKQYEIVASYFKFPFYYQSELICKTSKEFVSMLSKGLTLFSGQKFEKIFLDNSVILLKNTIMSTGIFRVNYEFDTNNIISISFLSEEDGSIPL
jgi:hypothetical protein